MHAHPPKIDCVVRVVTPENIEFEYMIAGPFQRLPAFLFDFALRVFVLLLLVFTAGMLGFPWGGLGALPVIVGILAYFLLSWFYGTYMESQFNGRTVGKMIFGLRVISADGRPINGSQAALRNLLRLCDFMPPLTLAILSPDAPALNILPTGLVGLLAMALTTRMQRVGDLAANTMVVWEGRRSYNPNLQPEDARAYALAELIPATFQASRTLARATALYMERRQVFTQQRREELAANLAKPLLKQFEMAHDTSSDLLLCALYVRIYQSEEQRLRKLTHARRTGQWPASIPNYPATTPVQPASAPNDHFLVAEVLPAVASPATPQVSSNAVSEHGVADAEMGKPIVSAEVIPAPVDSHHPQGRAR